MTDPLLDEMIAAVDGPRMMEHMNAFARWTKHAGTPEELESLEYCQAKLDDYGYETEIVQHDAYISMPGKAAVICEGDPFRCITHAFSRASSADGLRAPIVYLGKGTDGDIAAHDVRGKIVVVEGIANPSMSLRASRAGAAGQLHISPHEHVHEMCISSVWGNPTHETVHNLPGTVVVTVPLDAGTEIKKRLRANPNLEITLHADVETGWRKTPILIADLGSSKGRDDEPFVLFTGHHDTWYYGVMDNGGANATMLEVARLCQEHRDQWRRGLRIIFWSGHSQGRYSSSSWYSDAHWEELESRATVHVNIDSTGGMGNVIVADTSAAAELRELAAQAITTYGKQEYSRRRLQRGGDQAFWGIGVPGIYQNMSEQPARAEANASAAVFGTDKRKGAGTGWWWHTPDDLLDKIDEELLVRDTQIYQFTIWRLLNDAVLPLDYAEHARDLRAELNALHKSTDGRFDLSVLQERARLLEGQASELNGRIASASPTAVERINRGLTEVARALVPVDYTTGDRFEHDPALPQKIYPCLQPLHKLAELAPDSAEGKFLCNGMARERNRVAWALRQANEALASTLADLAED